MKTNSILALVACTGSALAQGPYPPYPYPTASNPWPTNPYSPVTVTANCTKATTSLTSTTTLTDCTATTTQRRHRSTVTVTSVSTVTVLPSSAPYTGPFVNVLGFRTSTCAAADSGNGFLTQFEDIKLALPAGGTASNCGQFGGYVGSISFLTDGTPSADGCTLLFYGDNSCNSDAPIGYAIANEADRCHYLASFNFQPGSVKMFCGIVD